MNTENRKAIAYSFLGKKVKVKVDRPLGSRHPKYPDIIYPLNYGHIPNIFSGDNEEIDVYILGVERPLIEFTGKIIAIINRENDVEDKLVAAPENLIFNQQQIAQAVNFQEKYFRISIDSIYRKSCGVIIFRKISNQTEYLLLLQKKSKTWSFPKGHAEINETEEQTALREVFEETGATVTLIPDFREEVSYKIGDIYRKTVVLFLAESNYPLSINQQDISMYKWVGANEVKELLYLEYENLIDQTEMFLKQNL